MVKRFEWDEKKAEATKARRGLLFEDALKLFLAEAAMIWWADRRISHEYRFAGLGFVGSVLHHVVFVLRGGNIRIISFRKANKSERKAYQEITSTGAEKSPKRGKKRTRPFYRQNF